MDGTFGGGDLISASLAIMLGGDEDAELHDKEVELSTSDITGSQTAIFEYNPQNETPTPWDGYSLFTIDLSGVKDDIEDLQQQVSDLEDELEDCHDCRDEVVAFIQQYIPDYDPQPDECPAEELPALVQAVQPTLGAKFITANETYLPASDNLDGYNQVVVDVQTWENCIQQIATKLGLTDPYDCNDIIEAIDEHEGYEFPEDTPIEHIFPVIGTDQLSGNGVRYTLGCYDYNGVFHEGVLSITYTSDYSSEYYQTWHNRFHPAVAVYYYSGDEEQRAIADATTWWDLTSNWTPRTIKGVDSISTTGVANLICSTHIQSTGEDMTFIAGCGSNAIAKQKLLEMVSANQYKVKNR